ncbi:MAG: hypothetical protein HYV07_01385 [Deltaproteobacteria bacterium]|nr:hypothetical protein [Deltaproteobacteria bacterium]
MVLGEARPDNLEAELIERTLANAARAPYYSRVWGEQWRGIRSLAALQALPLLDKVTAIENQRELIVGTPEPGFGTASSGTTRDAIRPALNVRRSRAELAAVRDLAPRTLAQEDPFPGWTLVVVGVHHGLPAEPPGPGELRVPWTYHANALSMLEAVLEEPSSDGQRVTAMRISAGALKTLTVWLLERGKDPSKLGVRLIGTNGSRLSPHWRGLISRTFGAEIWDNFSLSEMPTVATECKSCESLHFGWPPVAYEVLDLVSGAQKRGGAGRLVMSGLYPYVQQMPLIRYDTGDVVDLGGECPASGAPMIWYLGRVRRGLVVPHEGEGRFVLSPCAVQDVLEALPEAHKNPHPASETRLVRSVELGLPRWVVELGESGRAALLTFEARFDPLVYSARAKGLEERVAAELLALDAELSSLTQAGALTLRVRAVSPGRLSPPGDKFE